MIINKKKRGFTQHHFQAGKLGLSSKKFKSGAGFTLIELIVYIALISIVLVAGVDFMWQIINTRIKVQSILEVQQNARAAMARIIFEIRGAQDITKGGQSIFDTHPGQLTLDYPGVGTDVLIDTTTKLITVGGESVNIRKLMITEAGGSPIALTSDKVDVTNLVFSDYTQGTDPDNIYISLTVEYVNPGNDIKRNASFSVESTVNLRY